MLNKVRARRGIELPVEGWRKASGLGIVLTTLALVLIVVPVLAGAVLGLLDGLAVPLAIGLGSLVVVLFGAATLVRG